MAARAGLKFDVRRASSVVDIIEDIKAKKAYLAVPLAPSVERDLRFTRPNLSAPYVLVTRVDKNSPQSLGDMVGRRLAVVRGSGIRELLMRDYGRIRLVDDDSAAQSIRMVADREPEAAVDSLITASYVTSKDYGDWLQIISAVGVNGARMAFAMDRGRWNFITFSIRRC